MTQYECTTSAYRASPLPWFPKQGSEKRKQADETAKRKKPGRKNPEWRKKENQWKELHQSVLDWQQKWVGGVTEECVARQADPLKACDGPDGSIREAEHTGQEVQIALDCVVNPNLRYTISNLGQIPTDQYNFLPQSPAFWFHCNETTAELADMTSQQATVYVLRNLETATQMIRVDVAESSVPTHLYPSISDQTVELKESGPDPVTLWVRLTEQYPEFSPEKWMLRTFQFILPKVVQLFKDSAGLRGAEPYFRLQWMFLCFFGVDAMGPERILVHRIKTVEALRQAIADIEQAEMIRMALALDLEYFRVDVRYCHGVKCCDTRSQHVYNWNEICDEVPGSLCFTPFNKVSFQYVAQIIITTLSGATYLFNLLDVAQNEFKTGLVKKISDRPHPETLQNMALRPCSQPWWDFLTFLTDVSVIFLGWGKRNVVQVLRDTLGFVFVDEFGKRIFMSNVPGNLQLQRQVQHTDVQQAFSVSYIPWVAGYHGDEDPLNIPKSVKLDVLAWTVLCMAVTEWYRMAIFQNAIYKHRRIGGTDEVLHTDRTIYAPTNADRRCAAMEHRSLWRWYNVPRALILTSTLSNSLSLPTKRFCQDENYSGPDLTELLTADPIKPDVELTIGAGAGLYDQSNDEPAAPMAESVAETSVQPRERGDHIEGLSRFKRFRRSLTNRRTPDVIFHSIPAEPPSQQSASDKV